MPLVQQANSASAGFEQILAPEGTQRFGNTLSCGGQLSGQFVMSDRYGTLGLLAQPIDETAHDRFCTDLHHFISEASEPFVLLDQKFAQNLRVGGEEFFEFGLGEDSQGAVGKGFYRS